jgi:hypothetical protein
MRLINPFHVAPFIAEPNSFQFGTRSRHLRNGSSEFYCAIRLTFNATQHCGH